MLYREFSGFVESSGAYEQRIRRDAIGHPEGALFTLALPAFGFANHALAHPESATECRDRINTLIQIASRRWVRQWLARPMREDVQELRQWNGHGVYLGHYCLMLACYRLAGGDDRYADRQRQIAQVLAQGFRSNRSGVWIRSYPDRAWLFDSLPCLLAVRLSDLQDGRELQASDRLVAEHLRYRRSVVVQKASGFTGTEIDCGTGKPIVGPRGCDISASICFLGHLAPSYCQDLYARYRKVFWVEVGEGSTKLSGFREWPPGMAGFADAASGPILFDIGAAASGFGLGASRFAGDAPAHHALLATLEHVRAMVDTGTTASGLLKRLGGDVQPRGLPAGSEIEASLARLENLTGNLAISNEYHYRHLMADAVAFYCLTWRPWCGPVVVEHISKLDGGVAPGTRGF